MDEVIEVVPLGNSDEVYADRIEALRQENAALRARLQEALEYRGDTFREIAEAIVETRLNIYAASVTGGEMPDEAQADAARRADNLRRVMETPIWARVKRILRFSEVILWATVKAYCGVALRNPVVWIRPNEQRESGWYELWPHDDGQVEIIYKGGKDGQAVAGPGPRSGVQALPLAQGGAGGGNH